MPPRKKIAGAQAGSSENQQVEARVDHVSIHIEGTELPEEVRQPNNRNLVAVIEDLQRSQAIIWEEFQSLC